MNNLKRTLSLALAGVMTMGVMTVGASAAEFTDAADIENATAVNTMAALGVINGREDGSFDPNGTVNRAEMATMIAKALNGGKVPSLGLASMNYFTDVTADQWFAEAVNYCYSLGIIAGRGDGTFDPSANVTGWEAAKMMLVAMGYDSTIFGFTGSTWNTNVDYYATNLTSGSADDHTTVSLYSDVDGQRALPFTRNDAAQLIYNGMNANTITKKITGIQNGAPAYSYDMYSGSLLENNFSAKTVKGLLTKSSYASSTWTYTITTDEGDVTVTSSEDCSDLFMQRVLSVYDKDGKAYGISAVNSTVIASGVVGDASVKDGKIDGHAYDANGYTVYDINGDTDLKSISTDATKDAWFTYDLIDNTGDGKVDVVVRYPNVVVEVTAVKDGVVTAGGKTYTIDNSDASKITTTTEDEIEKGDWVIISETTWTKGTAVAWNMEKLELTEETYVTGSLWNKKHTTQYFVINGKNYSKGKNGTNFEVGNSYNFGIINDYVVVAKEVKKNSASTEDVKLSEVLYVYEIGKVSETGETELGTGNGDYTQKVRAYFSDGTTQIITVGKLNDNEVKDQTGYKIEDDTKALYTYVVKNGEYYLNDLDTDTEKLGFANVIDTDDITKATIAKGGEINGGLVTFADNGIFFVTYKKNDKTVTELFSGKQINAWKGDATVSSAVLYGDKNASKITELSFGVFTLGTAKNVSELPTGTRESNTYYGVATSTTTTIWDPEFDNGDGTYGATLYKLTIWDGKENKTYYKKTSDYSDTPDYGRIFSFTADENNLFICGDKDQGYTSLSTKTTTNAHYISAIAGNKIWLDGGNTAYELKDDTQIIYIKNTIDTTNGARYNTTTGVTDGTIGLGKAVDANNEEKGYYANVFIIFDKNSEIELMVVDVNGNMRASYTSNRYVIGAK